MTPLGEALEGVPLVRDGCALFDEFSGQGRPVAGDVDGDGAPDLLLVLAKKDGNARLAFFRNDRNGSLQPAQEIAVEGHQAINGVALLPGVDGTSQLVLSTPQGTALADLDLTQALARVRGFLPGTSSLGSEGLLTTGDINGDGLFDLAIGGPNGVALVARVPEGR